MAPKPKPLKPERVHYVRNKSSRHGAKVDTIVLHITVSGNLAGMRDIDAVLNWFDNPAAQASAHVINDREGHDARAVRDTDKAWACAEWNSRSVSLEQVENNVNRTREQWLTGSKAQLENTATWVAFWSDKFGIALTHRKGNGVCQHSDLGMPGGGHSDCGAGYPIDWVIKRARVIRKAKYGH
jgi:hypothetical protein